MQYHFQDGIDKRRTFIHVEFKHNIKRQNQNYIMIYIKSVRNNHIPSENIVETKKKCIKTHKYTFFIDCIALGVQVFATIAHAPQMRIPLCDRNLYKAKTIEHSYKNG